LDPVALKMQNYIPKATHSGIINNWDQSFPAASRTLIPSIKVDHNFSSIGGKLSVYFSRYYGPHFNGSDGLPVPITAVRDIPSSTYTTLFSRYYGPHFNGSDGLPVPITAVRDIPTSTYTTRVSYDWTLSPTTLLDVRYGYLRHHNPDGPIPGVRNFDPVKELGLVGALNGNGFPIIPSGVTSTGAASTTGLFSNTGGGFSLGTAVGGSIPATRKPAVQASLTHARNSHTYKTGF